MFVLASAVLMTVDHRQHHLDTLRSGLSILIYPIQFVIDLPATTSRWMRESFATRRTLQEENARLHAQHLLLQARLQKFEALEAENLRLRELLDSSFKVSDRVLIAELMSVEMDPYRHQVVLNKGERHNIFVGQPLVDAYGIMGQVLHVTPFTSTAMLITDPSHATPVQVNRNGLRSIAVGTGSLNELRLPHIPNSADIRVGDLLVTSGLGGRFPPGYPVATVVAVTIDPGHPFAMVSARPLSHLDRSREVLLVWKPPAEKAYGFAPKAAAAVSAPTTDPTASDATTADPGTTDPAAANRPASETPAAPPAPAPATSPTGTTPP